MPSEINSNRKLPTSESGSAPIRSPALRTSKTPGTTTIVPHRFKFGSVLTEISDEVGGSAFAIEPFIDAADDIDPKWPIAQFAISAGWVVGGIECVSVYLSCDFTFFQYPRSLATIMITDLDLLCAG